MPKRRALSDDRTRLSQIQIVGSVVRVRALSHPCLFVRVSEFAAVLCRTVASPSAHFSWAAFATELKAPFPGCEALGMLAETSGQPICYVIKMR